MGKIKIAKKVADEKNEHVTDENGDSSTKNILQNFTEYLKNDMGLIQQFLDRKRTLNFGNDILEYIANTELIEPEYTYTEEKHVDPILVLLRKRRERVLKKLQANAKVENHVEKLRIEARRNKFWTPEQIDPQQVAIDKGNKALVEPLKIERENARKIKEEAEQERIKWENKEAQVKPYLDEMEKFGEPRHRINSQFWNDLLGVGICEKNIKVLESPIHEASDANEMESKIVGNKTLKKKKVCRKVQMSEKEQLHAAACLQREKEEKEILSRQEKFWHPKKANMRIKLRNRFNHPPKPPVIKIIKPKPKELTDLERKQIEAKKRHQYEMEKIKTDKNKCFRPGELNDTTELEKIKCRSVDVNSFENKEYGLFLKRYLSKKRKEEIENLKWRNIVYPSSPERSPGIKLFHGFHPLPDLD